MALVGHACEKLLRHYQVAEAHGQQTQNEGDYHGRDGLLGSCEGKALKHQIFIVVYLQIVERKRSTVFNLVRSVNSGKETAQVAVSERYCLKNGSATPPQST